MKDYNKNSLSKDITVFKNPFDYFIWRKFVSEEAFEAMQKSVNYLEWDRAESVEYLKDNSTINSTKNVVFDYKETKHGFAILHSDKFIDSINNIFKTNATQLSTIVFLRMNKGFFNDIHSDENSFGELVRLILYLTPPNEYEGGELVLHNSDDELSENTSFKFPSNTLFGFKMCNKSYHSVKEVINGNRICLSMTYS